MNSPSRDCDIVHPILMIPRNCPGFAADCDSSNSSILMDLNISSCDLEGNYVNIYSGFCNVKVFDVAYYDLAGQNSAVPEEANIVQTDDGASKVRGSYGVDPQYKTYNMWPETVPGTASNCNYCDVNQTQEYYFKQLRHGQTVPIEQSNPFNEKNGYRYEEQPPHSSSYEKYEQNRLNVPTEELLYEGELEYGEFLTELSEEIVIDEQTSKSNSESEITVNPEPSAEENSALKQLISSKTSSTPKQTKTIMFAGKNSKKGQTIQNIAINDPSVKCKYRSTSATEVYLDNLPKPKQKKYQCDHCKLIFMNMASFKKHIGFSTKKSNIAAGSKNILSVCKVCARTLKSQKKIDLHAKAHGNPDLECDVCFQVFASKLIMKTHYRTHLRKHGCRNCLKTFDAREELRKHMVANHSIFMCHKCDFLASSYKEVTKHASIHEKNETNLIDKQESNSEDVDNDFDDDFTIDLNDYSEMPSTSKGNETPSTSSINSDSSYATQTKSVDINITNADLILAKVISNKVFLWNSSKASKMTKGVKTCELCFKNFDRISDLKRHLIEHVIKSTLAKTPVNEDGTLDIMCGVCRAETFDNVDKYKAHLRRHAKLTIYQCNFCDKSFSDSSNFSKHKKIHSMSYFECDMCQRRFNTKKMIAQHMEHHKKNKPVSCKYCGKLFYFQSTLNKHIRAAHHKELIKFRCTFCQEHFKSLRLKWDHEWQVHNVRKAVIDCEYCGSKFRKYSDLKRHCTKAHDMDIPLAKYVLKG